jgi:hypothetical protein
MLAEIFLHRGDGLRTRRGLVDVQCPAQGMGDPLTDEPPHDRVCEIVGMTVLDDRKEAELGLPSSGRLRVLKHAGRPVGDRTLRVVDDGLVPAAIEPLERLETELARGVVAGVAGHAATIEERLDGSRVRRVGGRHGNGM